jgi:RecG-like helicase
MSLSNLNLTPLQQKKLISSGVETPYSLITYFPYSLLEVFPFQMPLSDGVTYIANATILEANPVFRGKKKYLTLQLQIDGISITAYIFTFAPYILIQLKAGLTIQCLLKKTNSFWSILRYAPLSEKLVNTFSLGSSVIQPYLVPKYEKRSLLTNTLMQSVHTRLPQSAYNLQLNGLVPPNTIIPNSIDLNGIHHPSTIHQYSEKLKQFTALKAFLRMAVIYKSNEIQKTTYSSPSRLDKDYLQAVSNLLPYSLSPSQKTTIWSILKDMETS